MAGNPRDRCDVNLLDWTSKSGRDPAERPPWKRIILDRQIFRRLALVWAGFG